jgi:hypothetical protein
LFFEEFISTILRDKINFFGVMFFYSVVILPIVQFLNYVVGKLIMKFCNVIFLRKLGSILTSLVLLSWLLLVLARIAIITF